MVSSMNYWDLARALRRHGCTSRTGMGDHEVWYCPCGQHMTVVTRAHVVSPGVVSAGEDSPRMPAEGVVEVTTYKAHARRWDHGWEIHVSGIGVTQVRTLDRASQQACDLIATMVGTEVDADHIDLVIDLGGLEARAQDALDLTQEAENLRQRAARGIREVTSELRQAGLSVTDIAFVLGVSRGRVSQYLADGTGGSQRA